MTTPSIESNVDTSDKSPVVLSTCSGIRGLERGLEKVIGAIRVACYVEIEAFIIENLVTEMEANKIRPTPIWTNLKTLPVKVFRNRIDWLLGGYPCPPFSLAGKRRGSSDPRHLWPYYERIIKAIRPLFVFLENVDDHLSLGFNEVYESLRSMGYNVEAGVYSAEEAGAIHERQRLFILAVHNSCRNGSEQKHKIQTRRNSIKPTSQVANNFSERETTKPRGISDSKKKKQEMEFGRTGAKLIINSHVANSQSKRERKQNNKGNAITTTKDSRKISIIRSNEVEHKLVDANSKRSKGRYKKTNSKRAKNSGRMSTSWPSRPGKPQQAWEHPRVISRETESSMGFTANDGSRFSFREDFLRALGNMVVPDTAEIALRDLLRKHKINL